jgi:hypothetical protein
VEQPIKMATPKRAAPQPVAAEEPAAPSRSELLSQEVAHLRSVRKALASDPAQALSLANAGHKDFRKGVLYQEREALALQALSALGRQTELRRRGQLYLEAFPNGSFSEQVQRMLER